MDGKTKNGEISDNLDNAWVTRRPARWLLRKDLNWGGRWQQQGKKATTSLSLFMEAFALEAEEDLSTLGHPLLGRRGMDAKNGQ